MIYSSLNYCFTVETDQIIILINENWFNNNWFFLINKTGENIIFNISNKSTIKGIAISSYINLDFRINIIIS